MELASNQVASSSTYAMHCATTNQGACDSQVYVLICRFANKGLYSQSYAFSSSHIWTSELNHKKERNNAICSNMDATEAMILKDAHSLEEKL